jgi:hypothetical protein
MKTRQMTALPLLVGLFAVCLPMSAHHGNTAYEINESELKSVTVTAFVWANPHCIIQFVTQDANGKVTHWAGELGSPPALRILGWSKTSVKPGDVMTVYMHQTKTGNPVGRVTRIVLADGSSMRDTTGYRDNSGAGGGRGSQP